MVTADNARSLRQAGSSIHAAAAPPSTDAGVYLDYAATTPVDPAVARVMSDFLTIDGAFGNPASVTHGFGQAAAEAVENARREVAALVSSRPEEIVWTSGATEAINLALKGSALARRNSGRHIVTSPLEHRAVLDSAEWLDQIDADRNQPPTRRSPVSPQGTPTPGRLGPGVGRLGASPKEAASTLSTTAGQKSRTGQSSNRSTISCDAIGTCSRS